MVTFTGQREGDRAAIAAMVGFRSIVLGVVSLLLLLPTVSRGQEVDKFVTGESKLFWTEGGAELTTEELAAIKYQNGGELSVVYNIKSGSAVVPVGGFRVSGGVLSQVPPGSGTASNATVFTYVKNNFVSGVPYTHVNTLKSYRIDRIEVEVQRNGVTIPGGTITLRGELSVTGPGQFLTSAEDYGHGSYDFDLLTIPEGTGKVRFITRCYLSVRRPFAVRLKDLAPPMPRWFRVVSGSILLGYDRMRRNIVTGKPDTYMLFEGAVVGYNIESATGEDKECRPYKVADPQSMDLALTPVENAQIGYRTWIVTEPAEFRVASFAKRFVTYNPTPAQGVAISVMSQSTGGQYNVPVPSGSEVFEGVQLQVRVELADGCLQLPDPRTLRVRGAVPKEYTLIDRGGGVYEAKIVVEGDIAGLEVAVSKKQYTVTYLPDAPGPNVTIDWVRIGGEEGTPVPPGGIVHCGESLLVRFLPAEGYRVKKNSAQAQVNGTWEMLHPFNEAQGIYVLPNAKLIADVTAIRCEGEERPPRELTVRYEQGLTIGYLGVWNGAVPVPSGGKVQEGVTVRVTVNGLKGNVRPRRVAIRYAGGSGYEHDEFDPPQDNAVSFDVKLLDDVVGIDVEYELQVVRCASPDELALELHQGHVVNASGIDELKPDGFALGTEARVAKGSKLKVKSKGGTFPEDSYVMLEGCVPSTIDCAALPGEFEVVADATVSLKLGTSYLRVQYGPLAEGDCAVAVHEATRVKKGEGLPAEPLGAGEVVVSGWRLAVESKLLIREVGSVEGKKLLSYTVTMGGVEVRVQPNAPFLLTGEITGIAANYAPAYRVRYQREGVGYSPMEVRTANGDLVADGDLVAEGQVLNVRVTPLPNFLCTAIDINGTEKPYVVEEGVTFTVVAETVLTARMKEVRKFSLVWAAQDGVDMEVRLGSTMGEQVGAGDVKSELDEGTLVCVRASRADHTYVGLKVNGETPADLRDAGYWYTFRLQMNVTSIIPLFQKLEEPGEGETRVQYTYQFANVQVHRMVNGLPAAVPNNSLVPQDTELIITVKDVAEGYRFTCIIANDRVEVVEDTHDGVYRLNVGAAAHYNVLIVVDKPYDKEPRYIMVRKDDVGRVPHGRFVVYAERDGEARALAPGERYEIVPTDTYRAKLEPDAGYELAQSVFGTSGSGVILREDGKIDFDPTAAPRALYLLWATFKPVPTMYPVTWQVEGQGQVQVYDLAGERIEQGALLADQTEVMVEASPAQGYKFALFTANGLSMADAGELATEKVRKRLLVISPTLIVASFAERVVPPPPLPMPDTMVTPVEEVFAGVRLYPLPLSDRLHVADAADAARCALYDVAGRKLQEMQVEGRPIAVMDVSRLARGVYVLVLERNDGRRRAFRLVK